MRSKAIAAIASGLVLLARGPSLAQAPKAAIKAAAADRAAACTKAVDALVAQLRRYPARPSISPDRMGIYLIDAQGGEATLIAAEPEPGLCRCLWPSWSVDGKSIAFSARRPGFGSGGSRIKILDLRDGRLQIRDLGPGSSPALAPVGDRMMALHFPEGSADPQPEGGLWILRKAGLERVCLGGRGRPRWSPSLERFMIIGDPLPSVSIVDVRPDRAGELQAKETPVLSPPSWAGENQLVAAVHTDLGAAVALIDVSNPSEAAIREFLWWPASGPAVKPAFPIYSTVTGRCVFVGAQAGKGCALYSTKASANDQARRLENRALDQTIEDLAFSPDGRYVLFSSDRELARSARGLRVQSTIAPALSGITLDGDLKDWPAAIPRHAIQNMREDPAQEFDQGDQHASLSTSPDLSACFSVGYDPKEQLLYIAVVVRDDTLIAGDPNLFVADSVEIHVDGSHGVAPKRPDHPVWDSNTSARETPVLHYTGTPGPRPAPVKTESADAKRASDNPSLEYGDVKKTRTRMAFRRLGDMTTYEWAVQVFDQYPDAPTRLGPGVSIGLDVEVRDQDVERKPGQFSRLSAQSTSIGWSSMPIHGFKVFDPTSLGEVVLGRPRG